MNQIEVVNIIKSWIDSATKKRLPEKISQFWLLWDYVAGGMPDDYYVSNQELARQVIDQINKTKGKNQEACVEILSWIDRRLSEIKNVR